jgi:hypothetical protein
MSENAEKSDFIGLTAGPPLKNRSGAVLAITYVGQRDTRWLIPLTVSGWRQGEEGASKFQALAVIPRLQALFLFLSIYPAMRLPQFDVQIKSGRRM